MTMAAKRRRADQQGDGRSFPDQLQPQLATLATKAPSGEDWLHEVKYDGYRLLARVESGKTRLWTRNGNEWSDRFPVLARSLVALPVRSAWLDGEIVALREDGISDFGLLQNRLTEAQDSELRYVLFDLLWLDGKSLMEDALEQRKARLARLMDEWAGQDSILYSDHIVGRGPAFHQQACEQGLEGIVCKRRDASYRAGRGRAWLKIKCERRQEFVIGGYTESTARGRPFGSLLLGLFDGATFRYCGRVGTGFDQRTAAVIGRQLQSMRTQKNPFAETPPSQRRETLRWVRPELVAQVRFSNWTADGVLRHASFQGLREDKPPHLVAHEKAPAEASAPPPASQTFNRAGPIKLSNPDKLLFVEGKISKRALAAYYEAVAPYILPYVRHRPLSILRCPNGFHEQCFFQKHIDPAESAELHALDGGQGKTYFSVHSIAGLLTLAQMATLEIHVWGARGDHLDHPDQITFDLDPGPEVPWHDTVQAARLLRTLLEALKLVPYLKFTGGKGLHVVVPIEPRSPWDEVKRFSKAVAEQLVRFDPSMFTARLTKAGRERKIFIDYLRNGRGATAIAPYSTRARPGAPVAMPVSWALLDQPIQSDAFRLEHLGDWLDQLEEDPWANVREHASPLTDAMWAAVQQ